PAWTRRAGFPTAWPAAAGGVPSWFEAPSTEVDDVASLGPAIEPTVVADLVATDPDLGPGEVWTSIVVAARNAFAGERADDGVALLRPLVFRAPETIVAQVSDIVTGPLPPALVDAINEALGIERDPLQPSDGWRAAVVRLGADLIDDGEVHAALQLMRVPSAIDHPPASLVRALRARLATIYGLELLDDGDAATAPFLLLGARPTGSDDRRDLARLLFDAIVGSLYEPLVVDDAAR